MKKDFFVIEDKDDLASVNNFIGQEINGGKFPFIIAMVQDYSFKKLKIDKFEDLNSDGNYQYVPIWKTKLHY